ncbi:MAG: hypothetical protein LBL34_01380 [Clostridiales bacterium]|jgi:hypothetical protein|nr:hypothetical protein [Clostridiales bacterium]
MQENENLRNKIKEFESNIQEDTSKDAEPDRESDVAVQFTFKKDGVVSFTPGVTLEVVLANWVYAAGKILKKMSINNVDFNFLKARAILAVEKFATYEDESGCDMEFNERRG